MPLEHSFIKAPSQSSSKAGLPLFALGFFPHEFCLRRAVWSRRPIAAVSGKDPPPAFSAASAVRDALLREQWAAGDRSGAVVRGDVAPVHGESGGSKSHRASGL